MKYLPLAPALSVLILATACSEQPDQSTNQTTQTSSTEPAITYPASPKGEQKDSYFGVEVADPYRWLENDTAEATTQWVSQQNVVTGNFLDRITYRDEIKQRLTKLWNYPKMGVPFKRGDYTYFRRNDGLQNQSVMYRQKDGEEAQVFLDPNTFSDEGTTSLSLIRFSESGQLAAYSISEKGSDWRKIIVINTETMAPIGEPLENVKFSDIAWRGNEGFYYSSYTPPEGSRLSAKTDRHILYYHQVGTKQSQDMAIFGAAEQQKYRYVSGDVTDKSRFLVIQAANSTSGNKLYIQDLSQVDNKPEVVLDDANSDTYVLESDDNYLYLVTNRGAPKQKLVRAPIGNLSEAAWEDVIPETEHVLSISAAGGYFFAEYMVDALSKVLQYDFTGKKIADISLPGPGSVSSIVGRKKDQHAYFSFTNYQTPASIYRLNTKDGNSELFFEPEIDFKVSDYVSKQIFYTSKDGTRIPMKITHHKDIEYDGKNPTILYGYGGFNISLTPSFRTYNALWLQMGGVYAVPNIRGGGEYGKEWHLAGTKLQKQNVFDDFIAAAEYLIDNKYTSPDFLALRGGSNGGLLVGAVMTQRPDLMRVALPAVGVLDMLRYHTFTAGAGWAYDYGTSEESAEMFNYLLGYSPVHNVREGTSYPATLVTTSDHDDRVVPAHSYKFAAELQAKQAGDLPVMIRIEVAAGHGAGVPVDKTIQRYADIFSFTLFNMGFEGIPSSVSETLN